MLHNGGPAPNYSQSIGYYNYSNAGHQYGAQPYLNPQHTFKGFEENKFTQAANYMRSNVDQEGIDKVTGYSDDDVKYQIPEQTCGEEKLPKMVDLSSPKAHADLRQQNDNVSSPECSAKQTLPTFAWMINSSEDGMEIFHSIFPISFNYELLRIFSYHELGYSNGN